MIPSWLRYTLIGVNGLLTGFSIVMGDVELALLNAASALLLMLGARK
jgi:hypothetical protein